MGFPRIQALSTSFLSWGLRRNCREGIAGFGADHHMHSASFVEISDHLPLKIEFIESREKVDELLGKLEELAGTGMIEIQETTVAKAAQVSKPKKTVLPPI